MWNLAKTFAMVTVCLAAAEVASAGFPAKPFVSVTVKDGLLDLGDPVGPGYHQLKSSVDAHVVANCAFDIEASFSGLRSGRRGAAIAPRHLSVAVNGKEVPVGTGRVNIAQSNGPTGPGGEDVPVELAVGFLSLPRYAADRYHGTLVLTIMARP